LTVFRIGMGVSGGVIAVCGLVILFYLAKSFRGQHEDPWFVWPVLFGRGVTVVILGASLLAAASIHGRLGAYLVGGGAALSLASLAAIEIARWKLARMPETPGPGANTTS
jgi:hypothetical protein